MLTRIVTAVGRLFGATGAPAAPPPPARRRPRAKVPVAPPVAPPRKATPPLFRTPPSAGRSVRKIICERDTRAHSGDGLTEITLQEARDSLGPELCAYVDLVLSTGGSLRSLSIKQETADDAAHRGRLRRDMLDDLDLWQRMRDRRVLERIHAQEDGATVPAPFYVPPSVEAALAARTAARAKEAEERRKSGGRGGGLMGPAGKKAAKKDGEEADDPPIPNGDPPAEPETPRTTKR